MRQLLAVLAFLLAVPSLSGAQSIRLADVIVNNSRRDLLGYFSLHNSFDGQSRRALLNGLTIRFIFRVNLYQVHDMWPDRLLASIDVEHSIRYDALKEEFLVDRDGRMTRFKQLSRAEFAASEVTGLPVISLRKLAPNHTYQLQIRAARTKDPTSSMFNYLVSLFSFWDTETDSCSVEFRY